MQADVSPMSLPGLHGPERHAARLLQRHLDTDAAHLDVVMNVQWTLVLAWVHLRMIRRVDYLGGTVCMLCPHHSIFIRMRDICRVLCVVGSGVPGNTSLLTVLAISTSLLDD